MKTIPLTKDKVALVDDADYEALSKFRWCAQQRPSGIFHAARIYDKAAREKFGEFASTNFPE